MNWKIYALRAFLAFYLIGDVLLITLAIGGAMIGQSEMAITMLDHEGDVPVDTVAPLPGALATIVIVVFYLFCVIRLFLSLDRLMVNAHRGELAGFNTANTLRLLGRSLIWLWIAVICVETLAPILMFWNAIESGDVSVAFAPFDLKVVLALVGLALIVVAGLAEEADEMKKELSGVV